MSNGQEAILQNLKTITMDYFLGEQVNSDTICLKDQEMHHCLKVLRHKAGDLIGVTNGLGNLWICQIVEDDWKSKELMAQIVSEHPEQGEDPAGISLICCGPEDSGRMEWLIEKSVELGVSRLHIVKSARSGYLRLKPVRIESILKTAVKQCGRSRIPEYKIFNSLRESLAEIADNKGLRLVGAELAEPIRSHDLLESNTPITLCCGPEGDFTPEELSVLTNEYGFRPVSIGNTRLRSETACLALLSWAKSRRR
jgi:16S rRNA (uracil1498-N3)-methyltransferase